jgi:ketosteroid isomerase-like protein
MACFWPTTTQCNSLALALALATVVVGRATSQESAEVRRVRAELDSLYAVNAAAFVRGDVSALMALRADDFHTIAADGTVRDRPAMQEYMQGIINGISTWNQLTFVIDSLTVTRDTATAVVWQFLDRMGLRPDNQIHHVQTWVTQRETWVRHGDRWLLWRVDQLHNQRRLVDGRPG